MSGREIRPISIQSLEAAQDTSSTELLSKSPQTCPCKACLSTSFEKACLCLACVFSRIPGVKHYETCCRFTGCKSKTSNNRFNEATYHHERTHFGQPGNYHCQVKYCPLANKAFKRWADLVRHSKVAHCKGAPAYICHVLGCKFHERGFSRKDKLISHVQNVHAGKPTGGKKLRQLQPAVEKAREPTSLKK